VLRLLPQHLARSGEQLGRPGLHPGALQDVGKPDGPAHLRRDDDVAYVSDREDVHDAAVGLWRAEHAYGTDALTEVKAAAAAASQAKLRLDAAVALARHSGTSWADIGRAAAMARQSAQERWRGVDGAPAGGGA